MRQALELALEALQDYVDEHGPWSDDSGAQYVLKVGKEALAQPEQEPMANVVLRDGLPTLLANNQIKPTDERLYTTPPQPEKPDQDEVDIRSRLYQRIHELETQLAQPERDYERGFIDGMQKQMQSSVDKAVNRLAQPEQEYGVVAGVGKGVEIPAGVKYYYIEPKLPPQRKPLTDEQILHFVDTHVGAPSMAYPLDNSDWINFARAIEAAHGIKE